MATDRDRFQDQFDSMKAYSDSSRLKMKENYHKVSKQMNKSTDQLTVWWRSWTGKFDMVNICLVTIAGSTLITAGCALYIAFKLARR